MFGLGTLGNLGLSGGLLDPAPWALSSGATKATLDIDFVNDRAWSSPSTPTIASLLSCDRDSPGYYTNADGTLTKFGDVARTNTCLYSQTFDNAAWVPNACTVTANQAVAPDGTTTADKLVSSGADGYVSQSGVATTNGVASILSIWMKADTPTTLDVYALMTGNPHTSCDVTTSWQRFTVAFTPDSSSINVLIGGGSTFTTGETIYVWGAQVEVITAWNQSGPTAYIATTNAAVTVSAVNDVLRYGTNGLLVEESRANIFTRSTTLAHVDWAVDHVTVTDNAVTAPDGTMTAATFIEDSANASHRNYQFLTQAANTPSAISVYAKATASPRYLKFTVGDGFAAVFDVVNGVVTDTKAVNDSTLTAATITALANGWYRCVAYGLPSAGSSNPFVAISLSDISDTSGSVSTHGYAGDGVSGLYLWGPQYEAGSFPTSYIPTTSASVTRAADVVTFSDLTWFDGASESIYAEWTAVNVSAATVWTFDAANDVTLNEGTGDKAKILDAGATFAITTGNSVSTAATAKAAARMATNDIALCLAGGTVGTDTSATQPGTLAASRLGVDLSSANALNGYIRRAAAFKSTLLSNGALQTLTT